MQYKSPADCSAPLIPTSVEIFQNDPMASYQRAQYSPPDTVPRADFDEALKLLHEYGEKTESFFSGGPYSRVCCGVDWNDAHAPSCDLAAFLKKWVK